MTKQLACPPCGTIIQSETDQDLVARVQEHAQSQHNTQLEAQHILEEATEI